MAAAEINDLPTLKALTTKELTDEDRETLVHDSLLQGVLNGMRYTHLYTLAELQAIFQDNGVGADSNIAR